MTEGIEEIMTGTRVSPEATLPGMPEPEELWAVHVQGPDDILAASSLPAAEKLAAGYNAWYESVKKRDDYDPETFPRVHAVAIAWPFLREAHAVALREQAAEWGEPFVEPVSRPLPELEGFGYYGGLRVSPIGDDGVMIVLGHHDRRRTIDALDQHAREVAGLAGVMDDPDATFEDADQRLFARWAVLVTSCDEPAGHDVDACGKCQEIAEGPWWIRYDAQETDPDAFPVMIFDK